MNSMLRKMMYFSFGALTITREKAEKFFNEMVEKGEMSGEEAQSYIDEVMKKGQEQQNVIKDMIRSEFETIKKEFPFVSRSELKELQNKIEELENKLNRE